MQEIPESVKATVEAINKELRLKPENGRSFLKFPANFRPSAKSRLR
jgi:hypothetical protein